MQTALGMRVKYFTITGWNDTIDGRMCELSPIVEQLIFYPTVTSPDGTGLTLISIEPQQRPCGFPYDPVYAPYAGQYVGRWTEFYWEGTFVWKSPEWCFPIEWETQTLEKLDMHEIEMIGDGGVDIPTLALYSGNYQGGWFATFNILQFDSSIISANFQSNPTRYSFGSYSYQYHGFTVLEAKVETRKMYLPLHTWFPTLEPEGTPQDTNIWVPVPTWERATGVKWHLHPSVKGVCKVWWMKLWSGFDAYF